MNRKEDLEHVDITVPKELLEQFDAAWRKGGLFTNRTDAVRSLMREFIGAGGIKRV